MIVSTAVKHRLRTMLTRKKGVLVYVGVNKGKGLDRIFDHYSACYCFEPNPELFAQLKTKYAAHPHVHLIHAAAATYDGEIDFHISNYSSNSSVGGRFAEHWPNSEITMVKSVRVPCVNLCQFLQQRQVAWLDGYISDIQGYDLTVLRTLQPYIDRQAISRISCEVNKDDKGSIYPDLPDNSQAGFARLLEGSYELAATGWGILREGIFDRVPEEWWEMDCMWKPVKA